MKYPWLLFWLTMVLLVAIFSIEEPELLRDVKSRYLALLKHLRETPHIDPRFEILRRKQPILTGISFSRMNKGTIGYNVNKGYEIYLCIDGPSRNIDAAMHVLIHELAHMTVPEYDHTEAYWTNFKDLRQLAMTLGIFRDHPEPQKYCGTEITV